MERDGILESIWQSEVKHYGQEIIDPSPKYDVMIVGAGITGITSALMLQKKGLNCILAEASNMGFGTTGGTTAHLNNFFDTPYHQVIKDYNLDSAKLLYQGAKEVHDIIKDNINTYQIYCDYTTRSGYLFSLDEEQDKELDNIIDGHIKVGLDTFETEVNPFGIPSVRVIEVPGQAQFHPLKYLRILLKEFISLGGVFVENCRVTSVEKKIDDLDKIDEAVDKKDNLVVETSKGAVVCKNLIYATHIPPGRNVMHFRNVAYRSYVMAVKLRNGNYPEALGYDLFEPFHYYRTHILDGEHFLIAGGEDHKTGDVDNHADSFERLENYISQHFDIESIEYKWSSQFYEPADGLPYIGQLPGSPDNVYCATGYSGNGMIFGTLAAKTLSDIISTGDSIYKDLFAPSRIKPVAGFTNVIKAAGHAIKHMVVDKLSIDNIDKLNEIERSEGKVISYDGKTLAVYKDALGKNHIVQSDCTHLYCTVQWNNIEKSWDCPCHGSRFGTDGEVLNGPAVKKLKYYDT